jgi:hypothetical protein
VRSGAAARFLGIAAAAALAGNIRGQDSPPQFERPPIWYSHAKPHDAVARLLSRVADGEVALQGSDTEILRTVLRELDIPVESQVVVFSKTSLQAGLIQPSHPRAIYFSDSDYVGWVPGALVEAAAIDPELGPVFYAFDPQDARDKRRTFVREGTCLRCHGGSLSPDIPGLFTRSLVTAKSGEPLPDQGLELVDDSTPFDRRWGGWYVTGYTGSGDHRGNAFGSEKDGRIEFRPSGARPAELSGFFDTSQYLAGTSDILALMVLEHQTAMHNSLTRATQRMREALASTDAGSTARLAAIVDGSAQDVLDHLLFRGAAPIPDNIGGSEAFRRVFAARAHRSKEGDSLRDFSPHGRLFANRCSFLIHSDSFAALPSPIKETVLRRLGAVLRGEDASGRYAYLGSEERGRIREVLTDTMPEARAALSP